LRGGRRINEAKKRKGDASREEDPPGEPSGKGEKKSLSDTKKEREGRLGNRVPISLKLPKNGGSI